MRTLKKSLCLVLALVMVLGLCTIGSNAAYAKYKDMADVDYTEAVEVLTGLGVIEGYTDDSFGPKKDVTRAEAAAMIARMMLGREDADKLPVGDVKFTDVPETSWAAKYVAFCANKGIIVGMGDGTFHPSENVTGTQMATMLLRALGYGVMGEYEGRGWDINAVADALYYGVFKDSKVNDFSNAATREETALYVWNTMWIYLVGYDVDLNYYNSKGITFAKKAFNLVRWDYAQVMANQATGEDYTYVRLLKGYVQAYDEDGKKIKDKFEPEYDWIYLDTETGLDLIGHEVTIYFKDEIKEDKANKLDYYEIFFLKDESTVLNGYSDFASYDDLYRVLKDANKSNVDLEFSEVVVWNNYDYEDNTVIGALADWDDLFGTWYYTVGELKGQKSSMDKLAWYTMFGSAYGQWILTHDGKVLVVLRDSYKVGQVKAVDTDHDEVEVDVFTAPSTYDNEIFDMKKGDLQLVYDGIAEDDYVVVQPVGSLTYLKETGTAIADITERSQGFDLLTFAQPWSFNDGAFSGDRYGLGIDIEDADDPAGVGVGDKVKFYTITGAYGSVTYFGLEILERAKSAGIVYVNYKAEAIEHGEWDTWDTDISTVYKVQCIDQEGNEVVYRVKEEAYNKIVEGQLYEARVRGKYATFDSDVKNSNSLTKNNKKNTYLKDEDSGDIYYVTSDTKVIYFYGKGKDLTIEVANKLAEGSYDVYFVTKKSGGSYKLNSVWVPEAKGLEIPADYADSIAYIKDGTAYANRSGYELFLDEEDPYYTVYIDGKSTSKVHIDADSDLFVGEKIKGGFYQYSINDDGVYELDAVKKNVYYGVVLTKDTVLAEGGKYYLYKNGSDRAELNIEIVDVSADTTVLTKADAAVNTLKRLNELLMKGYKITVEYMYSTASDGNEIPTGVMYVTSVEAP